ncbi:tyrosine-type recombinase/integrase [Patiriisocius marinus]|uniref:tyrosine-type recombinase/integrase n=1 Tax=Patiriisocius marinus TaxID=1397112 RepID=UPI00232DE5BD|nr:site-specific integrase [Patiriisocius marinus]
MPNIHELIILEHGNEHVLEHDINYSIPKIYDANGDLSKRWYVYFSYRNPETNKLTRQKNIYGGANKIKDKDDRLALLISYKKCLLKLLEKGYSPYSDNEELHRSLSPNTKIAPTNTSNVRPNGSETNTVEIKTTSISVNNSDSFIDEIDKVLISDAFEKSLNLKKHTVSERTLKDYASSVDNLKTWLKKKHKNVIYIQQISKALLLNYLNEILERSSARNRNNHRTNLSSVFQVLVDNDIIAENFLKEIKTLRSVPKRNRGYSEKQQKEVFDYLKTRDPLLLLYIKFISYAFLRPIEACRLTIGDVDVENKLLTFKAKNKAHKTKIIPQLLVDELPDLSNFPKSYPLFSPEGIGVFWDATSQSRRDHFSKRYKDVVKNHFGFDENYGLYSFRHTYITKVYKKLRVKKTPFDAKSSLMLITGHTTMTALEKYLRTIDAEMPDDYSDML